MRKSLYPRHWFAPVVTALAVPIILASTPLQAQQEKVRQAGEQSAEKSAAVQYAKAGDGKISIASVKQDAGSFAALATTFRAYDVYRFDGRALESAVRAQGTFSVVDLRLGDDYNWTLNLQLHDIRSTEFRFRVAEPGGVREYPAGPAITYKGYVNGNQDDMLRMNIYDGQISGLLRQGGVEYYIEPVSRFDAGAEADLFVVYKGSDFIWDSGIGCGVKDVEEAVEQIRAGNETTDIVPACAEVAIAADYSMVQQFGSVNNVKNEVTAILNLVQAKYQETPMQISYDLMEIYVSSCSSCDPWTSSTSSSSLLSDFRSWGPSGFSVTFDIASLWTNRNLDNNGVIGLAYVGTVCNTSRFNIMEHYFSSQTGNMVDQTHEMGHNWNCSHYGSGDNTHIMSPTIGSGNTTWSTQSKNSIVAHRDSRTCLTASCQSPPVAQFTASTTVVNAGGYVDFTDLSSGNPTSWSWNFGGGGTPNTSTAQNPTIQFNTPGTYDVTLTATNANGSDSEVKTSYIVVNPNNGCDTLNIGFYQGKDTPAWTITNYYTGATPGANGWVNGININEELAKAQYFPNAAPYSHIYGAWMHVGRAWSTTPSKTIAVTVWDGTGATPGSVLGAVNVTMQQVISDEQGNFFTQVLFDPPVAVPGSGEFFLGVDITNLDWGTDKDTFNIVSNTHGQSVPSMVWEKKSGGNWLRYNTAGSWSLDVSLAIFPFMGSSPPTITTTGSSVCTGTCGGTASVQVSGGQPPFTYSWTGGGTESTKTGLCAGTFSVTVRQNNNCFGGRKSVTVSSSSNTITPTTSKTDESCGGACDGVVTSDASGGATPYSYNWSTLGAGQNWGNVCAGTYTVTVTDAIGCTATSSVTVGAPAAVTATMSKTDVTCFGDGDGTASVTGGGGTPGYTPQWSNGATYSPVTGLTAGTYTVTVTDANGCTAVNTVTINEPTALVALGTKTDLSCNGICNGTATASASGGTPAYTYIWSNTSYTGATQTGLCAGTLTFTVTDANGCISSNSVTISEPTAITLTMSKTDPLCAGEISGTITASPSGGTAGYSYLWAVTPQQTSSTATGLTAGTHCVTVTDANGCTANQCETITEPLPLTTSVSTVAENGTCNGSATVTAGGGTPGYTYSWSNGQTTATATGLCTATYTVTVTDANGCTIVDNGFVDTTIGLDDPAADGGISVYPNPGSGLFSVAVRNAADVVAVRVYNAVGAEILYLEGGKSSGNYVVDLGASGNGVYYVKVLTGNGSYTKKISLVR